MIAREFLVWMDAGEKLQSNKPLTLEEGRLIALHGNPLEEDVTQEEDVSDDIGDTPIFNPTRCR